MVTEKIMMVARANVALTLDSPAPEAVQPAETRALACVVMASEPIPRSATMETPTTTMVVAPCVNWRTAGCALAVDQPQQMCAPKAVVMEIEMLARGVMMVILSLEMAALMHVSSKVGSSVYLWAVALLTVAWRAVETAEESEPSSVTTEIPTAAMGVVTPANWRMGSSVLAGPPKQRTTALMTRSVETEPQMWEKNVMMATR